MAETAASWTSGSSSHRAAARTQSRQNASTAASRANRWSPSNGRGGLGGASTSALGVHATRSPAFVRSKNTSVASSSAFSASARWYLWKKASKCAHASGLSAYVPGRSSDRLGRNTASSSSAASTSACSAATLAGSASERSDLVRGPVASACASSRRHVDANDDGATNRWRSRASDASVRAAPRAHANAPRGMSRGGRHERPRSAARSRANRSRECARAEAEADASADSKKTSTASRSEAVRGEAVRREPPSPPSPSSPSDASSFSASSRPIPHGSRRNAGCVSLATGAKHAHRPSSRTLRATAPGSGDAQSASWSVARSASRPSPAQNRLPYTSARRRTSSPLRTQRRA